MEMPILGTFLARYANLHFFKHRGKRLHALINMKEVRHAANNFERDLIRLAYASRIRHSFILSGKFFSPISYLWY